MESLSDKRKQSLIHLKLTGQIDDYIKDIEEQDKEFIEERVYDSTKLLALFNKGELTAGDLRANRRKIKEEAGDKLLEDGE